MSTAAANGLRIVYLASLLSAALLAIVHPGLMAIRLGVTVVYAIPALALLPGVWRLQRQMLAASCFFAIMLLLPLIAEAWSEPQVRWPALISCTLTGFYLGWVIQYLKRTA